MIKNIIKRIKNRSNCKHEYRDIYCFHTGIFMYEKCIKCNKKKVIF